jgi:hypothetical protein
MERRLLHDHEFRPTSTLRVSPLALATETAFASMSGFIDGTRAVTLLRRGAIFCFNHGGRGSTKQRVVNVSRAQGHNTKKLRTRQGTFGLQKSTGCNPIGAAATMQKERQDANPAAQKTLIT